MKLSDLEEIDDTLREYQRSSKKKIYLAWEQSRSVMFQMPTGTGKTRLFSSIIKDTQRISRDIKKRVGVLVLAHRIELIEQISDTIGKKYHVAHGIIQSGVDEDTRFPVQVASVQTLSRRLENWKQKPFSYIIIDEAHHAMAKTYKKLCDAFPEAKILGVTATPCRLGGQSLSTFFDTLVLSQPVKQFMNQGYLSQYSYYSISPDSSLQHDINSISDFAIDGDYAEQAMMDICDKAKVRADIVKAYEKFAAGKKGIIYTINRQHSAHICELYKEKGIDVKSIDAETNPDVRKKIVSEFKSGKVQIICNVNIFSEGFDCPDIEFIQLARPTKSLTMYLQQVGRGLRPCKGKTEAIIIDNVGSYNRFGLPSANRHWKAHFEGYGVSGDAPEQTATKSSGMVREYNFDEGDEEMRLIYANGLTQDQPQKYEASNQKNEQKDRIDKNTPYCVATKYPLGLLSSIDGYFGRIVTDRGIPLSKSCFMNEDLWQSYVLNSILALDIISGKKTKSLKDYHVYKVRFHSSGKYMLCRSRKPLNKKVLTRVEFEGLCIPIFPAKFKKIFVPDALDHVICSVNAAYGVLDGSTMKTCVPFYYESLKQVYLNVYIASKDNCYGMFDISNGSFSTVLPFEFDNLSLTGENNDSLLKLMAIKGENETCYYYDYRERKLIETDDVESQPELLLNNQDALGIDIVDIDQFSFVRNGDEYNLLYRGVTGLEKGCPVLVVKQFKHLIGAYVSFMSEANKWGIIRLTPGVPPYYDKFKSAIFDEIQFNSQSKQAFLKKHGSRTRVIRLM